MSPQSRFKVNSPTRSLGKCGATGSYHKIKPSHSKSPEEVRLWSKSVKKTESKPASFIRKSSKVEITAEKIASPQISVIREGLNEETTAAIDNVYFIILNLVKRC